MDIYDRAMEMEKQGEEYYRRLARQSASEGLKKIFGWLADEEARHFNVFRDLKEDKRTVPEASDILKEASAVFRDLKDKAGMDAGFSGSESGLYRQAQDLEKKTEDYYREKSDETGDPEKKRIFLRLSEEERKHYFLLDNIAEFVSRPKTWLENAEFHHLEDY
jgi:rubrerythrin